jgi:hypothetical protein
MFPARPLCSRKVAGVLAGQSCHVLQEMCVRSVCWVPVLPFVGVSVLCSSDKGCISASGFCFYRPGDCQATQHWLNVSAVAAAVAEPVLRLPVRPMPFEPLLLLLRWFTSASWLQLLLSCMVGVCSTIQPVRPPQVTKLICMRGSCMLPWSMGWGRAAAAAAAAAALDGGVMSSAVAQTGELLHL